MLSGNLLIIGRRSPYSDNTVHLDLSILDPMQSVSRTHAAIVCGALIDLGSLNGTYLNGKKIQCAVRLKSGDRVRCGEVLILADELEEAAKDADVVIQDIHAIRLTKGIKI